MDGARIWNASTASGTALGEYGRLTDSLSVCFSKGLGAPVGSAIVGDRALIDEARRYRKIFGGGMRQAGILAAGALFALNNNLNRIGADHENAKLFMEELNQSISINVEPDLVETNMVIFDISGTGHAQSAFLERAAGLGVLLTPERGTRVRAVTHMDVTKDDVVEAGRRICSFLSKS
jgi:threonine aldolase